MSATARVAHPTPRSPERHLRVAPAAADRRRWFFRTVGAIVLSAFLLAGFWALMAQSAVRLDRLERTRETEQLRYQRLREEVARLASPAEVTAAASRLGMEPAARSEFISVPQAAPRAVPTDAAPSSLATDRYLRAKSALDRDR
ncbi:MAG: hypothetical protein ACKOBG_00325 [Actinomycetota bacterium]